MFLHLSVILLTGAGVCPTPLDAEPLLDADPLWMQTHPGCIPPGCRSPMDVEPLDEDPLWMQTPYGCRPPMDAYPQWMKTPWMQTHPRCKPPMDVDPTPDTWDTMGYGQQASVTHSTEMYTCFYVSRLWMIEAIISPYYFTYANT